MIPDLGKYAVPVLGSYAATLILLAAIVAITYLRAAQTKRALAEAEARTGKMP